VAKNEYRNLDLILIKLEVEDRVVNILYR